MTGVRWTEQDLKRFEQRNSTPAPSAVPVRKRAPFGSVIDPRMNKTEAAYASELELFRLAGEIKAWRFEAMKLRLANGAYYKPDFMVVGIGGEIEIHETKGFWREAARVRIKVAAEQHPWFRFIAVRRVPKRKGGGWQIEEF